MSRATVRSTVQAGQGLVYAVANWSCVMMDAFQIKFKASLAIDVMVDAAEAGLIGLVLD